MAKSGGGKDRVPARSSEPQTIFLDSSKVESIKSGPGDSQIYQIKDSGGGTCYLYVNASNSVSSMGCIPAKN